MSFIDTAWRRASGNPETIAATGAALITGAAVFLMPTQLLQNAVLASGLPDMFPPLDPPLGFKAKAGLALVAAGFAFGLVALLTRLVVGGSVFPKKAAKPAKVKAAAAAAAIDEDLPPAPRLRRRDRHPDAPARAPISISRDIIREEEAPARVRAPILKPAIAEQPIAFAEVEPEFEPAPEPLTEAPIASAPPAPAPVVKMPVAGDVPAPTPVAPAPVRPSWLEAQAPATESSLSELLERLERAMERRVEPVAAVAAPAARPAFDAPAEDDRLRSALENLKRFAPRRG